MTIIETPAATVSQGTITAAGDKSDVVTVYHPSSGAGHTGCDISLLGFNGHTIVLERRIKQAAGTPLGDEEGWGVVETYTADTERRLTQYVGKADYRLRGTVAGTGSVDFVIGK